MPPSGALLWSSAGPRRRPIEQGVPLLHGRRMWWRRHEQTLVEILFSDHPCITSPWEEHQVGVGRRESKTVCRHNLLQPVFRVPRTRTRTRAAPRAQRQARSQGLALATATQSKIQIVSTVQTIRSAASVARRAELQIAGSPPPPPPLHLFQVLWVRRIR